MAPQARRKRRITAIAEQRGRGQVVDLAGEHGAHQERVDQVVRVVDAEEHGPAARDDVRAADVHPLPEEPHPEAADEPDAPVEPVAAARGELDRRHLLREEAVERRGEGAGRLHRSAPLEVHAGAALAQMVRRVEARDDGHRVVGRAELERLAEALVAEPRDDDVEPAPVGLADVGAGRSSRASRGRGRRAAPSPTPP